MSTFIGDSCNSGVWFDLADGCLRFGAAFARLRVLDDKVGSSLSLSLSLSKEDDNKRDDDGDDDDIEAAAKV
eukprot:12928054-Prorocentrum_lima.AAC.1